MVNAYYLPCTYKEPPEATSSVGMYHEIGSSMYSKRGYTSGIRGQLYETKLLSLLYFRAIHDDAIQEFQLATNMDKIGAFSDICFKAKVKGHNKPVIVFIQAKHRENKKQALKIDLATYFDSYMKIRQNFGRDLRDPEIESLFVIFTNANVDYSDASATSGLSAKLNDILDMGGMVKQPNSEENIEYLTKKTVKYQIISLAKWIVGFICDDKNFELMLSNELFLRYHLILAQKVVDISDIQPLKRYRIASFRENFFDNNEEYIMLFRDTLYLEVIKRRRQEYIESDIPVILTEFLADPADATRLSKLIGTVVTYNNGQLKFNKQSTKTFMPNIKTMDVSQSTVNKAVELAAIEILSSANFKVPVAFGNKDLTLSGSDAKIEKRITYLTNKIINLIEYCEPSKVVTIDESLEDGFLQLNGGIAGGIGNIFVLDDNTQLMKITNNCETLGTHAKSLYTKLKSKVHYLHEYKFCFKVDKFPKLSFDCSHYEEKMARDFLNKILVYCNQAEENELQEILKNEIEDIQRNQPNYFQAKTDAIILRYYDEIQEWWMQPQHASYLSPRINVFRKLIDKIVKDPLMSSINLTYMSKIKQHDYTFTEDAVKSLNLQDQRSNTIIIAENCVLTVVKVLQHLKNKDHVVLDVKYIASLPTNDLNALRVELMNTIKEKVLIFVCDKIDSKKEMKTLKNIAEAVINNTNIIITDPKSLQIIMIQKYFPEADKILHDKKFSLIDVCYESQKSIFETATVVFPGVELRLNQLVKGWRKTGLTSAGEADAAGVAAVTESSTVTGSSDSGMGHRDVVAQKKTRVAETFPMIEYKWPRSAGEADAAGEAAVTESSTVTGSSDSGMGQRDVVAQKKTRVAETFPMTEYKWSRKPSIIPEERQQFTIDAVCYDMSGDKYLIILNQTIFFQNQPPTRGRKDIDVLTLKKVFGDLGFKENILEFENLKYEEIIKNLTIIARLDHSMTSCICITILTQADKGSKVHAADGPYLLGDVIDIFAKESSLVNKPKLLFVQASRGANMDAGNTVDLDSHSDSVFTTRTVTHPDFFLLCSIGEEPNRDTNGSWMIQTLCHYIETRRDDYDLLNIVTFVHRSNNRRTDKKYILATRDTLTKRLKF